MSEKISIIMPIYKVEQYLPKCIDSILAQTYDNLEVILVDDGSPDRCGEICDDYAKKDSRIRVIHKENGGVANARNSGIECATGDYISFIDSDDWLAENTMEILYNGLKEYDADCAVGGTVTVIDNDGELTPQKRPSRPVECKSSVETVKQVLLDRSAAWNRLFKREIFSTLRFGNGLRMNDDEHAVIRAYQKCDRIVFLDADTYYYRIRKDSITTSKFALKNIDCYYCAEQNLEFIREKMPELEECAEFKYMKAMLYCYVNLKKMKQEPEVKKYEEILRAEIRQNRRKLRRNRYLPVAYKVLMYLC